MRRHLLGIALLAGASAAGSTAVAAQGTPLTVDRLVSSAPSLAGTAPAEPAWSPDSRWLAFLWNDAGRPARDLWMVGALDSIPRRLTTGGVSDFAWLPDGATIIAVEGGRLRRVPVSGAATDIARAPDDLSDLTIAPDGRTLAYLSAGDLWFQPLAGGPATRMTHVAVAPRSTVGLGTYFKPDVEVGRYVWSGDMPPYAWSADGRSIAVQIVDRRGVRQVPFPYYLGEETSVSLLRRGAPGQPNERRMIAVLDVRTRRLTKLPLPDPATIQNIAMAWSSRGELLIDRESDTAEDRWLLVAMPAGRVRETWHDHRATRIYNMVTSAWHPAGDRILFVSDLEDRYRIYSLGTAAGSRPVPLTPADADVGGPRGPVAPVARGPAGRLWFVSNQGNPAERQVYRMPLEGGPAERITTTPGAHLPFVSPDGARLATISSDDVTPPELFVDGRRITHSPPAEFAGYEWTRPRYLSVPHQSEPRTIGVRIFEPAHREPGRRYPVLFGPMYSNTVRNQWGGLYGMMQQLLVQRGYIVVQVDVRGSTGYGRDFREQFLMDWGGKDLDDIESAVRMLRTVPYADTDRMGIWGSSYGGTLTVFMLFRKPGLFKAGVAGAPATNPYFFGSDDVAIARRPGTNPEAFERGNALKYAANLRDHLLIIHGMQDDVVPFKTSVVLADSLMKLGKDFDFAFAPAATHGWTQRPYYARFLLGKLVAHFDRYLKGAYLSGTN